MDYLYIIIAVIVVIVISLLVYDIQQKKITSQALNGIDDFIITKSHFGENKTAIAVDIKSGKVAFCQNNPATWSKPEHNRDISVILFKDIISVETFINGQSVFTKSAGKQIGGAAVGGILLGPAGLLLGALLGGSSQNKNEKVKEITLRVGVSDIENPSHEVLFFSSIEGYKSDNFLVKKASKDAQEWTQRVNAIISKNE